MSISSSEGSPLPPDLSVKYQKLAAEYAKVRSQVNVLKKAVVEEQTRSSELKELVKLREQTIRKNVQELESLNFRNTQLTKRVTVLQEELDRLGGNNKKGRTKSDNNITPEESILFQEELQNRIVENANLLSLIDEKNQEFERERSELVTKLFKLEKECSLSQATSQCQCSSLRIRISELESALRDNNKSKNERQAQSHSAILGQLKELPLYPLLSQLAKLRSARGYISDEESLVHFQDISSLSSHDSFLRALKDHLLGLSVLKTSVGDSDKLVGKLLSLECDFVTGLILCFNTKQLDESICKVIEANKLLSNTARSNASQLRDDTNQTEIVEILKNIRDACDKLCSFFTEKNISVPACSSTCKECQIYKEKLLALENQFGVLKLAGPESNGPIMAKVSSTNFEPKFVENEFGTGTTTNDDKEFCHGNDFVSKCVTDRQFAESRVSRLLNELTTFYHKLENCQEELREKTGLANKLEDELLVTSNNYETQLSSMSEHLANLSDKLVAQKTLIDDLTLELNMNGKRGRGK